MPRVSERFAQSNALDEDIARLKYVSGKREEALRRLGIRTVGDLLLHIPHRYLDFTRSWSIEMAPIGTVCTIIATVDRIVQKQPRPRMQVTEVSLVDETSVLQVAFFRQPWIAQQLKKRKAERIFICATFGLFTDGLEKFDKAYKKGLFNAILTTNLTYQKPGLLEREWYQSCDLSKFIALIIDTLNHDGSLSELLNPVDRINKFLAKKGVVRAADAETSV